MCHTGQDHGYAMPSYTTGSEPLKTKIKVIRKGLSR